MKFEEFKESLLVAIVEFAERADGWIEPKDAPDHAQLKCLPGLIYDATRDLEDANLLSAVYTQGAGGPDRGVEVVITGRGWDRAQEILEERARKGEALEDIAPASDRLVRIDHNSATYKEATEALTELYEAVKGNNAYASDDPDEYDQRIAEIESGQRLLEARRVRLAPIVTGLLTALKDLAKKFVDKVLGRLAEAAIRLVTTLLGL